MKKHFTIFFALCIAIVTNGSAQGLVASAAAATFAQNNTSNENSTNNDIVDTTRAIFAEDHRSSVMFGFKVGINSSSVYNDVAGFQAQPVVGYVAGAFLTLPISKLFGFQPELLYEQKGFKSGGVFSGNDFSFSRKAVYTDIPLLLQVKPGKSISVFAGPLLSFLVYSNDSYGNGFATNEQKTTLSNGTLNKNILGAEGGVDIYIQKMVASLRGGMDLKGLNGNGASNSRAYQNYWIQATLGYNLF